MTVPGGCSSQGCHNYILGSLVALLLFHQEPSPYPSIVDGFNHSLHGNKYCNSLSSLFLPLSLSTQTIWFSQDE